MKSLETSKLLDTLSALLVSSDPRHKSEEPADFVRILQLGTAATKQKRYPIQLVCLLGASKSSFFFEKRSMDMGSNLFDQLPLEPSGLYVAYGGEGCFVSRECAE